MKYVYLLRMASDYYKVGIATSVTKRLQGLQTSNPEAIEVVSVKLVNNAESVERSIHNYLKDNRANGGREWFKLSPAQALDVSILMNREPEATIPQESVDINRLLAKQLGEYRAINSQLKTVTNLIERQLGKDARKANREQALQPRPKKNIVSDDQYVEKALIIFKQEGRASTSLLQRRLSIGYSKAARIVDKLEALGMISPLDGIHRNVTIKL